MLILSGHGAPTNETVGNIGDRYIDLETNTVYECKSVDSVDRNFGYLQISDYTLENTKYTWQAVTSVGGLIPMYIDLSQETLYLYKDAECTIPLSKMDVNKYFIIGCCIASNTNSSSPFIWYPLHLNNVMHAGCATVIFYGDENQPFQEAYSSEYVPEPLG